MWLGLRSLCFVLGIFFGAAGAGCLLRALGAAEADITLLYALAVLMTAGFSDGLIWDVLAAALACAALRFFFVGPVFSFRDIDFGCLLTFAQLLAASLLVWQMRRAAKSSDHRAKEKEWEVKQEQYRTNLLRSISHDLRTPLTGIMGTAEMIAESSGQDDPRKKLARDIYQDAAWLFSLVENILGLTRLRSSGTQLNCSPEALEELVAEAVSKVAKYAGDCPMEVALPEEYIEIQADARLLVQVFVNLLDNAVKHTAEGKGIALVAKMQGADAVIIRISDEGEGIAEEELPNVFELFYTSGGGSSHRRRGTGLGLTVSKLVVEAHGGSICAENRKEGKGAVFTVTLPCTVQKMLP